MAGWEVTRYLVALKSTSVPNTWGRSEVLDVSILNPLLYQNSCFLSCVLWAQCLWLFPRLEADTIPSLMVLSVHLQSKQRLSWVFLTAAPPPCSTVLSSLALDPLLCLHFCLLRTFLITLDTTSILLSLNLITVALSLLTWRQCAYSFCGFRYGCGGVGWGYYYNGHGLLFPIFPIFFHFSNFYNRIKIWQEKPALVP